MIEKKRPRAEPYFSHGIDGWDSHWTIKFTCPTCGRWIFRGYKSETACDQCGTFYDWGDREPRIEITRTVDWS